MAHRVRDDNGLAYAQSYYNYRSTSRVTEAFVRSAPPPVVRPAPVPAPAPMTQSPWLQDQGWNVAPNDAHIHFYDEREVIVPAYSQNYGPPAYAPTSYNGGGYFQGGGYSQGGGGYYQSPPMGYGYPGPQAGIDIEDKGFTGGVGYETAMGGGNGGGGGGGSAFIVNSGGASDEPPNGGGVNTPAGYGPTYRGVWQGPTLPSRGGLATSSPSTTGTTSK